MDFILRLKMVEKKASIEKPLRKNDYPQWIHDVNVDIWLIKALFSWRSSKEELSFWAKLKITESEKIF